MLWAGPRGALPEPRWVGVRVTEINERSTGPEDVPWLRVFDGESLFGMRLCDIAVVRRDDPTAATTATDTGSAPAGAEADTAYVIDPTPEQAWRLVGHIL